MNKLIILIFALLFSSYSFCQNKKNILQDVLTNNETYLYSYVFFMDSTQQLQKTDSILQLYSLPEVYAQVGWFYYFQDNYVKAIEIANKGLLLKKIKKDHIQLLHVLLGESATKLGRYQRAIEYFGIAVVYKYPYHLLYLKFADLYWKLNNKEKSISYLRLAELMNASPIVYHRIGRFFEENEKNYNEALKWYKRADEEFYESVPNYKKDILRMYDKIKLSSFSSNIEEYTLEHFPYHKELLHEIIKAKLNNKNFTNFYKILYQYRMCYPHTSSEWNLIGNYYDDIGMIDSAMYFYKISIENDTNEMHAYGNLGLVATRFNFTDTALKYIHIAIQKNPNHAYNYQRLVQAYLYNGDLKNAYKYLMKYEYIFRKVNNYLTLGFVSLSCGYYEDAIGYLHKHLENNKKDDRALNNLSWAYYHLENYDSAQYYMSKVFSITQKNSYAYHNRAALNLKLGNIDKVCDDIEKAIEYEYNYLYDKDLKLWAQQNCSPNLDLNKKVYITGYKNNFKQYKDQSFLESENFMMRENALKVLANSNIFERVEKLHIDSENLVFDFPDFPYFFSRINYFKKQYTVHYTYFMDLPLQFQLVNSQGKEIFQTETKNIYYKTINLPADFYVARVKNGASIVAAYHFEMK